MAYELVKYDQTDTGLFLSDRPEELTTSWGEIIGAFYNPPLNPCNLIRPKRGVDHLGLLLRFKNHEGFMHEPELLVQDNSDIGHVVELARLDYDSNWRDLSGEEVFLHFGRKGERVELYGFSFDYVFRPVGEEESPAGPEELVKGRIEKDLREIYIEEDYDQERVIALYSELVDTVRKVRNSGVGCHNPLPDQLEPLSDLRKRIQSEVPSKLLEARSFKGPLQSLEVAISFCDG